MKNKGFTLIELLAVIVILAIIALITVPIVINIVSEAKYKSKIRSYEMIEHAANLYATNELRGMGNVQIIPIEDLIEKGYLENAQGRENEFVLVTNKTDYYYTERRTLEKNYVEISAMEFLTKKLHGVEIGDYVNYNSTSTETYTSLNNQIFSANQDLKWQVLGVDSRGRLNIISEKTIGQTNGGEIVGGKRYYVLSGSNGYIKGVDELNKISQIFGHGDYAVSARSVNLDDLKVLSKDFRKKLGKDYDSNIGEFGTKTVLTKSGSTIEFNCSNGSTATGSIDDFFYFDSTTNQFTQQFEDGKEYIINNTYMGYYPKTVYNVTEEELTQMSNSGNYRWISLLYESALAKENTTGKNHPYWLATRRDYANPNGYNSYGMLYVDARGVNGKTFVKKKNSTVTESEYAYGIRPVITLDSNANSTIVYSYNSSTNKYDIFDKVETNKLCNRVSVATNGTIPNGNYNYGDEYICNVDFTNSKHFFVLAKTADEVSLIMDRNVINNVSWCLSGTDNSCNADGALRALAKGTSTWFNIDSERISLPTKEQITTANGGSNYPINQVWLYDYLKTSTNSVNINGYWLKNKKSFENSKAWTLYGGGTTRYLSSETPVNNTNYGVRPVITIPKSMLD